MRIQTGIDVTGVSTARRTQDHVRRVADARRASKLRPAARPTSRRRRMACKVGAHDAGAHVRSCSEAYCRRGRSGAEHFSDFGEQACTAAAPPGACHALRRPARWSIISRCRSTPRRRAACAHAGFPFAHASTRTRRHCRSPRCRRMIGEPLQLGHQARSKSRAAVADLQRGFDRQAKA